MGVFIMNEMQLPVFYNQESFYYGSKNPSTIHSQQSQIVGMYRKYLLQKAMSIYKWSLPKEWPENVFKYWLYCNGCLEVLYTREYGVIPQLCGFQGWNIFYMPTHTVVNNQNLHNVVRKIDTDCVLFHLQEDYQPVMDLINNYAEELALCSIGISINLINTRLTYAIGVGDKKEAESAKKIYDKVAKGEPAVVYKKNDPTKNDWQFFNTSVKQNYIVTDLLSDMRKIENRFNTDFGIPNTNTEKRERMIQSEVESNDADTRTRAEMWLDNLKKSCEKTRKMFGIEIDVDWAKGVVKDDSDIIRNVAVQPETIR
jgi:hypothetical protein